MHDGLHFSRRNPLVCNQGNIKLLSTDLKKIRWTGWETSCTLHQERLGDTVSQAAPWTLTPVPLLPVPTL